MLMRELLRWGEETLRQEKIGDADTDAWLCLEKVLGISRTCYYMKQDAIIEEEKERSYRQLILRRAGHTPVQQLLGEAWFAGLPFYVNDQVLIPRQDTEVLVEEAKKRLKSGDEILDLCTGSGCILLAILKSCEGIRGTGADLSENALLVAKENGERLGVPASWIRSDLFQNIEGKFNLITSNPPYIASEVIPGLMPEVRDHEPLLALDGGEDGLDFYRKIVSQAGAYLKKGGWLCLEIGYDQGQPLREMLLEAGYEEVEIIRDLAGLDRTAVVGDLRRKDMFDKLEDLVARFEEVLNELSEPGVTGDQAHFQRLMKEQSDLQPLVDTYRDYKKAKETIEDSLAMLEEESDEEMREMLKEELSDAKKEVEKLEHELKILLLPKDPNDEKNIMVEIRAGAGGDEAALFAAELYRMYVSYAESMRWKTELVNVNENGIGGFKECVFMVTGQGAYSRFKYESGVHRVQRVPATESGGRIHTSTATVAVMPEAEDVDVKIDMNDCRIDVMRASGNGGQCVNTTDSAVRLTHMPTGIVIYSQTEKSQLQNKEKAFRLLRSKLYDLELEKQQSAEAEARRSQIGTGDRSEKIRTYNFPQGRVTDHRIKLTLHRLEAVLDGDLDEVINSLIAADQAAKLSNMQEK